MVRLPDPKVIVDSIADGVIEVAEGPVRAAKNVAAVADSYASNIKGNMDDFKTRMPDDPAVIVDVAVKTVGQTVNAGIGLVKGIGNAAMETFGAVESQIKRVTG